MACPQDQGLYARAQRETVVVPVTKDQRTLLITFTFRCPTPTLEPKVVAYYYNVWKNRCVDAAVQWQAA